MTYKKLKTVTHTLYLANGQTEEILLPVNYQIIFDNIRSNSASSEKKKLYKTFIKKYSKLQDFEKEKYQHLANSGRFKTDGLSDLLFIFKAMHDYFSVSNIESFDDVGRLYASMNCLEYNGDPTKVTLL